MIYLKYLVLLLRHKWFVMQECFKEGLYWRGIVHDLSKFLPDEFISYARAYCGDLSKGSATYFRAWQKHYQRNSHHWEHHILVRERWGNLCFPMSLKDRKEMLCDWRAAGRSYNNPLSTREWYIENYFNMKLSPMTRLWVNIQLNVTEKEAKK